MLVVQQTRVRWFLKIDSLSQVLTHVLSCLKLSFHNLLPLVRIQGSHPVSTVILLCCVYCKCLPLAPSCPISLPVHDPWLLLSCFLGTRCCKVGVSAKDLFITSWIMFSHKDIATCLRHASCHTSVCSFWTRQTILFNKTKQKVQK